MASRSLLLSLRIGLPLLCLASAFASGAAAAQGNPRGYTLGSDMLLQGFQWKEIIASTKSPGGIRYGGGNQIVLQGFHWNSSRMPTAWYVTLKQMAPTIAADGFTAIWMPPPWRDDSSWKDDKTGTSGGGEGYFWRDFDKNGHYGTDAELKQAAQALAAAKIMLIYDIVPNHRDRKYAMAQMPSGEKLWRADCPGAGNNGPNGCDDGDGFTNGDADLDIANTQIADMFAAELGRLRSDYSAGGFRFDFVRGYAPEHVQKWMANTLDNGFCVGELWKAPNEFPASDPLHGKSWQDVLKNWSDRAGCAVFDFALKERMQNGSINDWRNGLNGNPDARWREIAVTFVDNHDTGYSPGPSNGQHHWALPDSLVKQAYTYILTSPGTPTVYWPHMYDWGLHDYLRLLIQLRRAAGVRADAEIQFFTGYSGLVAQVKGSKEQLLVALNSNLSKPAQVSSTASTLAVSSDNGNERVWRSGAPSTKAAIPFRCDKGTTQQGDSVYVVGSSTELGDWDPAKAVRLTDVSAYPAWKGSITLATPQAVEWKCIVRSESNPGDVRQWQPGGNNQLVVEAGAVANGSF